MLRVRGRPGELVCFDVGDADETGERYVRLRVLCLWCARREGR